MEDNQALILIVDDDLELCELLNHMLMADGYRVKVMNHAQPAMDYLRHTTPDAIVLDIMMPDIDGFELLTHIRSRHPMDQMPVIMLSARMNDEAVQESAKRGANGWLSKADGVRQLVSDLKSRLGH